LHHDNAPSLPVSPGNFWQKKNNKTVVPIHPIFLFPRLKIKLKGCHFDTTEVIEACLQAVLDTLTKHDFHDAFKNTRNTGNDAYMQKGTTSRVMVASRHKVSFYQIAALVPEIMDGSLY
jgi:hypothetical protein